MERDQARRDFQRTQSLLERNVASRLDLEQAELQLTREPRPLPTMRINPEIRDIDAFTFEDFTLENYDPHPHIKAEVAV